MGLRSLQTSVGLRADARRVTWRSPMVERRAEVPLLVAFVDLTRFFVQSQRVSDVDLADTLDAFYECVATRVEKSGGRVVKFMGDAALLAFPEHAVDRGVETLLDIKDAVDELVDGRRWDCRLTVKAHFGATVAGPFGAAGA